MTKVVRLGQWNGRRRSSRRDEPLLRRLAQPGVLVRLVVVGLTTGAFTLLAMWWGRPLPFRAGETYAPDLRGRVDFELVSQVEIINHDERDGETKEPVREQAQNAARPVLERYPRG